MGRALRRAARCGVVGLRIVARRRLGAGAVRCADIAGARRCARRRKDYRCADRARVARGAEEGRGGNRRRNVYRVRQGERCRRRTWRNRRPRAGARTGRRRAAARGSQPQRPGRDDVGALCARPCAARRAASTFDRAPFAGPRIRRTQCAHRACGDDPYAAGATDSARVLAASRSRAVRARGAPLCRCRDLCERFLSAGFGCGRRLDAAARSRRGVQASGLRSSLA